MSETLDLDALAVEQTGEPFTFKFGGEDFSVPPAVDIRVVSALREGDWAKATEILVGAEQWQRIMDSDAVLTLDQAVALVNAVIAHTGTTVGKSSGSLRSSKSKAKPSKRTSNSSSGRASRA